MLHNKELHSLYSSLNKIRVIKTRRLQWEGHVEKMDEDRSAFKILNDSDKQACSKNVRMYCRNDLKLSTGEATGKAPLGKLRF